MFYFAISLKSKKNSRNWGLVMSNLQRTLSSVQNQSNSAWNILIATNDFEEIKPIVMDKEKTTLINADFDVPNARFYKYGMDKLKKRRLIGSYLKKSGADKFYLMFLDADDMVHKDLVGYVYKNNNKKGYLVEQGYIYDNKTSDLFLQSSFYNASGSCYIGYFSNKELPRTENDIECFYSGFRRHAYFYCNAYEGGKEPDFVPFPAVIYLVNHEESIQYHYRRNKRGKLKKLIRKASKKRKKIRDRKKIDTIKDNFGFNIKDHRQL